MRWLLLLCVFASAACDYCDEIDPLNPEGCLVGELTNPPLQYRVHGQKIRFEQFGPTEECYRASLGVVVQEAQKLTKKSVLAALDHMHIGFYPEPIVFDGVLYAGITQPNENWIKVHYPEKIAGLSRTAWTHEIAHVIGWYYLKSGSDPGHENKKVWDWVEATDYQLLQQVDEVCANQQE